jgi:enoyl-CoA hydratase
VTSGGFWRFSRRGAVARFALDSPDGRQVLSPALFVELARGARSQSESGARVVAVASARPGIFAAGADLSVIRRLTPREAFDYSRDGQEALAWLGRLSSVVVAEIDGPCFGGACDLAMACDLRIATARSSFSHPGPRLGIVTGWGGTALAPRLLGRGGARRLFGGGSILDSGTARRIGLVDEVVALEAWEARCAEIESRLEADEVLLRIKSSRA